MQYKSPLNLLDPTDPSFYLYCDRQAYKIANGTFVQGKYLIRQTASLL